MQANRLGQGRNCGIDSGKSPVGCGLWLSVSDFHVILKMATSWNGND